jgi:hypothetical protein
MTNPTPVALAVEPLRISAIERAKEMASARVEMTFVKHAEDPSYHARPDFKLGRTAYAMQKALYVRFLSLTTKGARDEKKVEAFISEAGERASAQYTAFIQKLEGKIGEHVSASIEGEHIWGSSLLTVTKATHVEKWRTQQIVNVSVLGKVFNQWPSRKVL